MPANPMQIKDLKRMLVKIEDGDSNSVTVKIGDGNITWSEKKNREYMKDRGNLDRVRDGDEEPMEVSLEARYEYYKSNSGDGESISPVEAIKQQHAASAWVSVAANTCDPYAVDLVIEDDLSCGTTLDEKYVFPEFRYESIDFDPKAGTISFSGKCNAVEPIVTREAIT